MWRNFRNLVEGVANLPGGPPDLFGRGGLTISRPPTILVLADHSPNGDPYEGRVRDPYGQHARDVYDMSDHRFPLAAR